ncbi:MAG: hypothetical protein D4S02_10045 [Rhodocyclaceae bacterium]|nr:MAG: hypothetical protein D4S02_10045 [Rhodocyclaceae bacterium]
MLAMLVTSSHLFAADSTARVEPQAIRLLCDVTNVVEGGSYTWDLEFDVRGQKLNGSPMQVAANSFEIVATKPVKGRDDFLMIYRISRTTGAITINGDNILVYQGQCQPYTTQRKF